MLCMTAKWKSKPCFQKAGNYALLPCVTVCLGQYHNLLQPMASSRKNPIVRNPDETVVSFNLPKTMKSALVERAVNIDRPYAQLIRWAIEAQIKKGWADVPLALTEEELKKRK